MFGVLLESRSRRPRRTGGAVLSVATHLAIVGAVTAATVAGTPRLDPPAPKIPVLVFPSPPPEPRTTQATTSHSAGNPMSNVALPRGPVIDVPTEIKIGIPPIEPAPGEPIEFSRKGILRPGLDSGLVSQNDEREGRPWQGNELLMRIVTSAKPVYPEPLRQAGIGGTVLVRFVVDTLGRIDPASVRIITSTHELFSTSVRDALAAFRFKPTEVGGRRVAALAEMPFEFQVGNRM